MSEFISRLVFFCLCLVLTSTAGASGLLGIKQGANQIDLNGDGRNDLVLLANFDNNKSHPSQVISFYINKPDGGYSILPSIDENQFSYFDLALSGSNVKVSSFALYKARNQVFFITSDKQTINAFDQDNFSFNVYALRESDEHPGIPLYQWVKLSSVMSHGKYLSAEESFSELNTHFSSE